MIDVSVIRNTPEVVEESLRKRGDEGKIRLLQDLIAGDKEWRRALPEVEELKHRRNLLTRQIQEAKSQGKDVNAVIEEAKGLPGKIREGDDLAERLKAEIAAGLIRLPNILHERVPVGAGEHDNIVVKAWGEAGKPEFELLHNGEFAVSLGGADSERAVT